MTYSMAFSGQDGLWEVNLALNAFGEFSEQQSFGRSICRFVSLCFGLLVEIEETV